MTTTPDSLLVAAHWPYVRRNLELSRRRPMRIALDTLAELQCDAGGEPVSIGAQRLLALDRVTSRGEAARVCVAMRELERRRVVVRLPGRGRRPAAWSLRADLRHWRAMPWRDSGRSVETAICSCACASFRAVARHFPASGVVRARQFWLSAEDHLGRAGPPGLLLVDSTRNGAKGRATARRPGETFVDSTRNGAAPRTLSFLSEETSSLPLRDEEDESIKILRRAVPGFVWGGPERDLVALGRTLNVDQAACAASMLERYLANSHVKLGPPQTVKLLYQFAAAPSVRMMADEA